VQKPISNRKHQTRLIFFIMKLSTAIELKNELRARGIEDVSILQKPNEADRYLVVTEMYE
jgi:hypothetical protein